MMPTGSTALWLTVLLLTSDRPATVSDPIARFALVIGVNKTDRPENEDLRYADDDAWATHQLLRDAGVASTLLVSPDSDTRAMHPELRAYGGARRQTVFQATREIFREIGAARAQHRVARFFLFYSGHGGVDHGEGYVVLDDGRLTRKDLFEQILVQSPADENHVIIDACKSYFLVFDRGPGGTRIPFAGKFVKPRDREPMLNTGFVLSTSSGRDSHEWERYQGGVFSHEVRSGLRGAADADQDGAISYAELGAFLTTANAAIPNPKFRPDFVVQPPGAAPTKLQHPLLFWHSNPNVLVLGERPVGHVYVETASGQRLVDIHPEAHQPFRIYLPATRPLFVRSADESAETVLRRPGPIQLTRLHPVEGRVRNKGALNLAFRDLFAHSFGQKNVSVFRAGHAQGYAESGELTGSAVVSKAPSSFWQPLTLSIAGGMAALGAGVNLFAYYQNRTAQDLSQRDRQDRNRSIRDLNTGAAILYGVAGAALAAWLITWWWSDSPSSAAPDNGVGDGLRLD